MDDGRIELWDLAEKPPGAKESCARLSVREKNVFFKGAHQKWWFSPWFPSRTTKQLVPQKMHTEPWGNVLGVLGHTASQAGPDRGALPAGKSVGSRGSALPHVVSCLAWRAL